MLLNNGDNATHDIIQGWWKDTGKAEDIIEANRLVLDELQSASSGTIEDDASLQGRISIGRGSIVKKGALIRGPVVVAWWTWMIGSWTA